MNICVIGTGYVGLVSGVCFSEKGNNVTCVDLDVEKIKKLKNGTATIYEEGLEDLLKKNISEGRLKFTSELSECFNQSDVIFIAVGTPPKENGEADLQYIKGVAVSIGQLISSYKIIVTKSTVPVGTGSLIKQIIAEESSFNNFDVVSNPEFLREGSAIFDTMNMERAIIGTESSKAAEVLRDLHLPFTNNIVITNRETAEMIKYASNAFLATKISFINEIANLCELVGADVTKVAEGMGYDKRIGHSFLQAGIGYGGSCFPKDTSALVNIAEKAGYNFRIVKDVEKVNTDQRYKIIEKLQAAFDNDLSGKNVAVLGLAFKPNTDDMRDAPAVNIIPELIKMGCQVKAYDPVANENAKMVIPHLHTVPTVLEAIDGADALLILTDWQEFKKLDFHSIGKVMNKNVVIDGRNLYSPDDMKKAGFYYSSIGRKTIE
ncbi:UDP-glucose dehydrogenase family protein [Metabacillus indicus]|uniref:UDP-glucose 6-dehydrogenase n=1 Tax=Metabacillus indicus TaxID=246786 RepID=A0A084GXV0_METID|nr:UDP-glucose/GDP-mannose dehydrogenase family protein [Metabacillus indicus]KEZ52162.1 UDP-glucose 6-dehydrogenase [Metabacillus indicus]